MLVLEYMEGGDLAAALQNDSGSGVLADRKLRWYGQGASLARDIAEALVFLHSRQVRPSSAELQHCLAGKSRPGSSITMQTAQSVDSSMSAPFNGASACFPLPCQVSKMSIYPDKAELSLVLCRPCTWT